MSFTYRGTSSDTMFFNVTERQVYNAPAFDVNAIEVPGRSGDVLNSQNRFKNKQITYTGFLRAQDFPGATEREKLSRGLRNLKAWICGDAGKYHDLTDDYDPGFIRRAFVSGETAVNEILDQPDGVTITVTFYAEPFMYEDSEPIELPETQSVGPSPIASFSDGADNAPLKSLIFSIEPQQDLHGFDYPWPAGGGKNLCPTMPTTTHNQVTFTAESDGGYTLSGTASGNAVMDIGRGSWALPAGTYYLSLTGTSNAQPSVFKIVNGTATQIRNGNGSFTLTDTTDVFVRLFISSGTTASGKAYVQVEAGSSSTTFAPYSNICPISGTAELDGVQAGGNLLDVANTEVGTAWNGATTTARARLVIPIKQNTDYILSMNGTSGLDGVFGFRSNVVPPTGIDPVTFPWRFNSGNNSYLVLGFNKTAIQLADVEALKLQLEPGSTATAYHAYQGTPITIDLGRTVYGGTVDVINGAGESAANSVSLSGANANDASISGNIRVRVPIPNDSMTWTDGNATTGKLFCDKFPEGTNAETGSGKVAIHYRSNGAHEVVFGFGKSFPGVTTYAEAVAWLNSNTPQVVYWYASAQSFSVTPQQISSLLGQNNIWHSAGETEVEYVVPTENPTAWPSKPRLEITMSGAGTLTVNGKTWAIGAYTGTLICDSEIMDWYDAGALKNSLVSGDGFPELVPGENVITYTGGITKVVATPRWRTL